MEARILGVGTYRPGRIVGNEEICRDIDSTPEWIAARSGIMTRRFASGEETVVAMGATAAGKALAQAGVLPANLDAVLVASMSYLPKAPTSAAAVAHQAGATRAAVFEVGAACAGFCHAVAIARDLIRGDSAAHVLVVGSERMTDIVDPRDRATSFLFGDGAGAVVIGQSAERGIGPVVWGAHTDHLQAIRQEGAYLRMSGQEVYRWAIRQVAPVARAALDRAGLTVDELAAFIPHQANLRITDALVSALDLPETVTVARHVIEDGNTSAASIPLAMEQMLAAGVCRSGDRALLVGFGAGLSYAAQVVTLP